MASISENPTCVPADLNRNLSSAFPVAHEIREQIYKNTFYLTPDAININRLDDGLYVSINPGFTNATGYEASDIIGRTSLELNIWVNQEDRMRLVDGLRQHGSVSNLESQFRTKSGDIRIGQMSAAIVQIENVAHIISVTRDITNRKNLEQQQRDSEERFRRLAEDMPAFVVAGLPDGTLTYANDAIANLVGLNKEELIGMNFFEFLTPTDREMVKSKLAALTPEHPVETHEQIYLDHQQSLAYHQWTNRAFFDITGRMSGFQSVGVDITEMEKQAEALRATKMEFQEARDHYEELYEFAPIGYVTVTATGQIEAINLTGAVLLGYERSKIVNRRFSKFIAPAHQIRWNRQFEHVMKQAEVDPLEIDLELTRADGSNFYGHLHCVRRVDARRGQWLRIAISDISRSRIADLQSRIAAVAFESQEGILILDSNQRILRVNQAFIQITGYTAEEAIGQLPPTFLSSPRQPEDFFMRVNDTLLKQGAWQGEMWHRHKNGSEYQISLMITAVKDDAGTITNFVAAFTDITFRKRAEEKIANLAFRDQLTQLPNRRLLLDRLKQALELSARTRLFGALLFIDLDNFKTLNETQGHEVGDILLQQLATRLSACVRDSDTVARLGGDEFVVMREGLGGNVADASNEVQVLGSKILKAVQEPFQIGPVPYINTASIGIACFSGDRLDTVDEILKQADLAMYQAKDDGRNTLRVFDSGMQTRVAQRATIEADLQTALREDQFRLFYQPQVTETGQIYAAEALLRWQHPTRGLVQPVDFISIAEETGLILPLGSWVLDFACAQLARWAILQGMNHLRLSINVSARQFHYPNFVDQVREALTRNGINPNLLKLKLTESLLLKDVERTIAKFKELRSLGVRFSLDDFGTGYSSLSYLRRLPLDQLKIDQSFVRDIPGDLNACIIVKTILALGESLGLQVIAEGVESQEQRDFLVDSGCRHFQGFLFGRPMTLDDLIAFVNTSSEQDGSCPVTKNNE